MSEYCVHGIRENCCTACEIADLRQRLEAAERHTSALVAAGDGLARVTEAHFGDHDFVREDRALDRLAAWEKAKE